MKVKVTVWNDFFKLTQSCLLGSLVKSVQNASDRRERGGFNYKCRRELLKRLFKSNKISIPTLVNVNRLQQKTLFETLNQIR